MKRTIDAKCGDTILVTTTTAGAVRLDVKEPSFHAMCICLPEQTRELITALEDAIKEVEAKP